MTVELWTLVTMGLLQLGLVTIHGTYISLALGLRWGMGRRDQSREVSDLGRRIERSIINTMEGIAVFVPIILVIQLSGLSDNITQIASQTYVTARIVYAFIYIGNIFLIRTLVWLIGQACLFVMGFALVGKALAL